MKDLRNISLVLVFSACITVFLYIIDTDPPYPEKWRTVLEFIIVTLIVFSISVAVFYLVSYLLNLIRKK